MRRSSSILLLAMLLLAAANNINCQVKGSEEIYEIDYKGPETHSFWPPPRSSRSGPRMRNRVGREKKPGDGLQRRRSSCRKGFMCD